MAFQLSLWHFYFLLHHNHLRLGDDSLLQHICKYYLPPLVRTSCALHRLQILYLIVAMLINILRQQLAWWISTYPQTFPDYFHICFIHNRLSQIISLVSAGWIAQLSFQCSYPYQRIETMFGWFGFFWRLMQALGCNLTKLTFTFVRCAKIYSFYRIFVLFFVILFKVAHF